MTVSPILTKNNEGGPLKNPDERAKINELVSAVSELQQRFNGYEMRYDNDRLLERLDELESRLELMSNLLRDRLHGEPPKVLAPDPLPAPMPSQPPARRRDWLPVGDGQKLWTDENGFTQPADRVPEEALAEWNARRQPGTPRAEAGD